jgi:hypothetical protein
VESTPYTGARHAFAAAADIAEYPAGWGTLGFGLLDMRGALRAVTPLPLARRHTLALALRARELAGGRDDDPMLLVGGNLADALWHNPDTGPLIDTTSALLPPGVRFFEALRGFEDYPLFTNRAFIADAAYRYPIIIDAGWASTLWLLPALFLRQIDLQLFGAGATTGRTAVTHLAAGASASLQLGFGAAPLALRYQLARRFSDDRALVHLVTLGLGI